jgi:hypothetical protein
MCLRGEISALPSGTSNRLIIIRLTYLGRRPTSSREEGAANIVAECWESPIPSVHYPTEGRRDYCSARCCRSSLRAALGPQGRAEGQPRGEGTLLWVDTIDFVPGDDCGRETVSASTYLDFDGGAERGPNSSQPAWSRFPYLTSPGVPLHPASVEVSLHEKNCALVRANGRETRGKKRSREIELSGAWRRRSSHGPALCHMITV